MSWRTDLDEMTKRLGWDESKVEWRQQYLVMELTNWEVRWEYEMKNQDEMLWKSSWILEKNRKMGKGKAVINEWSWEERETKSILGLWWKGDEIICGEDHNEETSCIGTHVKMNAR